jgi:hypothetical protein
MDFNFTRLPLFSGLILRTPSSVLHGFPVRWPKLFVGFEFPAFVVVGMLLLAVGAFRTGLAGLFFGHGWGHGRGFHRGKEWQNTMRKSSSSKLTWHAKLGPAKPS